MREKKPRRDRRSDSEKLMQTALESLHNLEELSKHPFTRYQVVDNRRRAAVYGNTAYDRGRALRDLLKDLINGLKPGDKEPEPDPDANPDSEWHHYIILNERCVREKKDRKALAFLAHCLNISTKTCGRKLNEGLLILWNNLQQQEEDAKLNRIANDKWLETWIPRKPAHKIIGRGRQLETIKNQLAKGDKDISVAFYGGPGAGKTALAVELAHNPEVRNYFPDGILWASLEYQPNSSSEEKEADILYHLENWRKELRISLKGSKAEDTKGTAKIEGLRKSLKQEIASRSTLIVVDNVWNKQSVQQLNIKGGNCAYLITTRNPEIARWFAGENAIFVAELSEEDSQELIAELAPRAYSTHPEKVHELLNDVRGLPLLLVLMGSYLNIESLSEHPRRLQDAFNRLKQPKYRLLLSSLDASIERPPGFPEDVDVSLAAWIKFSEELLDKQSRRALQALSMFPPKPNTFTEEAALAISEMPINTIDALLARGLLESSGPTTYTMHPSINDYVRWMLRDEEVHTELVLSYVHYYTNYIHDQWLYADTESTNIFAALDMAYSHMMRAELVQTVNFMYEHHVFRSNVMSQMQLERALEFAKLLGDPELIAITQHNLGKLAMNLRRHDLAQDCFYLGLINVLKIEDKISQKIIRMELLDSWRKLQREYILYYADEAGLKDARIPYEFDQYGIRRVRAGIWVEREWAYDPFGDLVSMGNYEDLVSHYQKVFAEKSENHEETFSGLVYLGSVEITNKNYLLAKKYLSKALEKNRTTDLTSRIGFVLRTLAVISIRVGAFAEAQSYLQEALMQARKRDDPEDESYLWMILGSLKLAARKFDEASSALEKALEIARETINPQLIADVLDRLAKVENWRGNEKRAFEFSMRSYGVSSTFYRHTVSSVQRFIETSTEPL